MVKFSCEVQRVIVYVWVRSIFQLWQRNSSDFASLQRTDELEKNQQINHSGGEFILLADLSNNAFKSCCKKRLPGTSTPIKINSKLLPKRIPKNKF